MLNCENLTTEVVVMDVFGVDAEGIEQLIAALLLGKPAAEISRSSEL